MVIDLEHGCNKIIVRNESFHMWEHFVKGQLLRTGDFLVLSYKGTQMVRVAPHLRTKTIKNNLKKFIKLHCLHEFEYLKLNQSNHLLYQYSENDQDVEIKIQDIYKQSNNIEQMQI